MRYDSDKKFKKISKLRLSRRWLIAGSLLLSGLLVFLVIGATRSSEIDASQKISSPTLNSQLPVSPSQGVNYTELLKQQIFSVLIAQLPEDLADATETLQALRQAKLDEVERSIAQTDTNAVFGVTLSQNQILTSTDNSKTAISDYLTKMTEITTKAQKPLTNSFLKLTEKTQAPPLEQISRAAAQGAENYKAAAEQTRNLIAPEILAKQHLQYLALVLELQNSLQALADFNQDPYKALLAMAHLDKLAKRGAALEQEVIAIVKPIVYER